MTREEVLQKKLIYLAEQIQQARLELGEFSNLYSFHFCPDSSWISIEHEKVERIIKGDEIEFDKQFFLIERKSPACITILTKI